MVNTIIAEILTIATSAQIPSANSDTYIPIAVTITIIAGAITGIWVLTKSLSSLKTDLQKEFSAGITKLDGQMDGLRTEFSNFRVEYAEQRVKRSELKELEKRTSNVEGRLTKIETKCDTIHLDSKSTQK